MILSAATDSTPNISDTRVLANIPRKGLVGLPNPSRSTYDVSPTAFEDLLRYVYGCELSEFGKDVAHIKEIICVANKYGVTNLKIQAEAFYVDSMKLDSENLLENLQFADAMNCSLLREAAVNYVVENPMEIIDMALINQVPEGLLKDVVVALARKEIKNEVGGGKFNTMSVGELRFQADGKGLDVDGSREMLISALTQYGEHDE